MTPTEHLSEVQTGVWEYRGEFAPEAVIRIVRHRGRVQYRVTKWRPDGDGELVGYFDFLAAAVQTIGARITAYRRRQAGQIGAPNHDWARSMSETHGW